MSGLPWGVRALFLLVWLGACELSVPDPIPGYGFHAGYDTPKVRPDDWCGVNNGGWRTCEWSIGPHAEFARADPARLAQDSLLWFEGSTDTSRWRGNASARLELKYPSDDCDVAVYYDSGGAAAWETRIRAWFERFPPRGGGRPPMGSGDHDWTIQFGRSGSMCSIAPTDQGAVEAMKKVLAADPTAGVDEEPTCELGTAVQRSSHVTDCYSVRDAARRVEDLPRKLREKRENPYGRS